MKADKTENIFPGFTMSHPDLPIFRIDSSENSVLYTPGKLAVLDPIDADYVESFWRKGGSPDNSSLTISVVKWMEEHANKVLEKRKAMFSEPYLPECLTVCLSSQCNLDCSYCYSTGNTVHGTGRINCGPEVIDESVVRAASLIVAENCVKKNLPFHLVLHGGGEPSMHWELIQEIVSSTRSIARDCNLDWFGYIATNGLLSVKQAEWLAANFTRVGLSCDGPPDIQNKQRPLKTGGASSPIVERTASIIVDRLGDLIIRATITPGSFMRQEEIAEYFVNALGATEIVFEPVYGVGEEGGGFSHGQADEFTRVYMDAHKKVEKLGCSLSFSGVRLDELHGPYCDPLRNVLRLMPDGSASACFLPAQGHHLSLSQLTIGGMNTDSGLFTLDQDKITAHRRLAMTLPVSCRDCINIYHCTFGCPEQCPVSDSEFHAKAIVGEEPSFRCVLHQQLSRELILRAASQMIEAQNAEVILSSRETESEDKRLESFLSQAPPQVDQQAIIREYRALTGKYDVNQYKPPGPGWEETGFAHNGPQAWNEIIKLNNQSMAGRPMSIYIHIPFCDQLCGFCDCYSLPKGRNWDKREDSFTRALVNEIDAWGRIGGIGNKPVTTIHFGGGTPNCLSNEAFERILLALNRWFLITNETEWAVEITSRLLTERFLERLLQWEITRLHVGVQSLNDSVRRKAGRLDEPDEVLAKIKMADQAGFLVSVDVIYGLPGQTMEDIFETLTKLNALNIPGVSMYRFNFSRRNKWFAEMCDNFQQDALYDYALLQVAEQILSRFNYAKQYFNHYARAEDRNLYFTYPQRGEDLLAVGPTADGVFGDYMYRHPGYGAYMKNAGDRQNPVSLQGGAYKPDWEQSAKNFLTGLNTGRISRKVIEDCGLDYLMKRWIECELLSENPHDGNLILTANGTWLINEMILDVRREFQDF